MSDMKKKYNEEVVPALTKSQGYKNVMQVPKLKKIVISMGIGSKMEKDAFTEAKNILTAIAGQLPVVTKARKNVANFKLRVGMPVGLMVTLRGNIMYEFLDRLVHNALPRVRDFRGIPKKGFDHVGNYNLEGTVPNIVLVDLYLMFFGIIQHSLQAAAALIIILCSH